MSEQANPKSGVPKSGVPKSGAAEEVVPDCPHCGKPLPLCICDSVTPIESRISLLILQHPQEQDRALGTARLTAMHFKDAVVKIGLSWPSLSKALGRKVDDPSRWAVLYLGSAKVADLDTDAEIVAINRKGEVEPHQRAILSDIEGIVLLDGTWSQAKALWWRNAWMLKCQRVILGPKRPSRYGKLRKEPRGDGLPPSRPPDCCWRGSKSGLRSPRRSTPALTECWRGIGKCRPKCPSSRPSRRSGIIAVASGADFRPFNQRDVDEVRVSRWVSSVAPLPAWFQCLHQGIGMPVCPETAVDNGDTALDGDKFHYSPRNNLELSR